MEGWYSEHTCTYDLGIKTENCTVFALSLYHLGFPGGSGGKESAYNSGNLGSIPGWRRSPGEGNGNPPQCSCF